MEQNEINQCGDNEYVSRNLNEDSSTGPKSSPKKTVICTEEEFIQTFVGIVKSEIYLGDYEFDGVIKSELTDEN